MQLREVKDGKLYVYLNPLFGSFDAKLMRSLSNVVDVNISNCVKLDPKLFVNAVVHSQQITHVSQYERV